MYKRQVYTDDIDFVINIDINLFIERISNKSVKINKKNIKYKTISIILGNKEYQITSFRKDLISFGRGACLLYTSDAADEEDSVDLGGRRIIKKKKTKNKNSLMVN